MGNRVRNSTYLIPLPAVFAALIFFQPAADAGPGLDVKLTTSVLEIYAGQTIGATIHITNNSTFNFEIPRPERASFAECVTIDNSTLHLAGGTSIVSVGGEGSTLYLAPGQSVTHQIALIGTKGMSDAESFSIVVA